MRIGLAFDLKGDVPLPSLFQRGGLERAIPDDCQEEFDSPGTIEAIASVMLGLGHDVELLGDGRGFVERVLTRPPDFVFNIAEGQGIARTREARVPAVLEMLGIPYSGSDPLTLAVTLDKDCAKRLVQSAGVLVPRGFVLQEPDTPVELRFPVIVKPAWEGSSKGIRGHSVVDDSRDLQDVVARTIADHDQPALVEEFIEGEEITVGLVGNGPPEVIGMMQVLPRQAAARFVYSLEVKRDYLQQVDYHCPPLLPVAVCERIRRTALTIFRVLGCRDVARVDFRLRDGEPFFLEVNPLPGLNPESSDLVILAGLCGWSYPRLIESILGAALSRRR